jgi:peptidyl-prolyl cis-trans isomerase D
VSYVVFNPDALIADSEVSITDQAIRDHYNRNRDNYLRPAQASVRYVSLSRTPTAADSATAREQAAQYRAAIAGGESFDAVAERAAGDLPQGRFTGQPFPVQRNQSAPVLDELFFTTPVGQVSQPVRSGGGYHIVQVDSRAEETAVVRQIVVPIQMSEDAENRLLDRADSLERAADRMGLEQAAAQLGLQVRTGELTPALPILPGVGAADDGVDWVFNEAEVGEVSPVMENDEAFYVLELVTRREEGPLSLQEATPTIRAYLMVRAKLDRARQTLADAERRARAGEPLDAIAAQFGGEAEQAGPFTRGDFVPGLGRLNAAIGAGFGLQAGETSGLIESNSVLYLVRTLSREEADPNEWRGQVAAQRARVLQALGDARWNQFMVALRENADIVDNRNEILRRTATANGR